CLQSKNCPWTF
nr:immunoglobulin light chain junction region [Macaca mulatta]MOY12432.1 immunoglobulin light chain junction region [Macaca mulatta]MOY12783.1 immunoglobulin light chain junction region [Macaca mulatta]